MSQRIFNQNGYEVVAGWDRPLAYHFVTIYQPNPDDHRDSRIVFDNLARPEGPAMSVAEIRDTLASFGLTAPSTFYDDLARDERLNVGNLVKRYHEGAS